uniref:SGNH hydrolase-type esterase domain-containing protein n=1 Tax=Fibrocapsa japonica TaxID=94617 RepID=A0A7S2V787_9STRA|mmetsp:Transcript_7614/g.11582  ORF Transcript_7614/g.11582 Transcript_7614/m.11582 type:complete len:344 (+) Transcript_7614:58-1089(+)|eukprot:CAMPEP_0113934396 /NCGR_PEP_ID=MMETSP1339-20121228/1732_1 /TAXON_ID=94617 /ORGANISM="Fibrocapsa japonica" /LENGTH=343 /DNA_ID=CAMNT_0000936187 /DNA_START=57 /DNA_END=1088 /DNA_ORIENTATION=- /assembly_acc=CAM_ASM_000762
MGLSKAIATGIAISLYLPSLCLGDLYLDWEGIVSFGDSLSDAGNMANFLPFLKTAIFPSPPYDELRASNGPTWPEYLKNYLPYSENFMTYAYSGATTSDEHAASELIPHLGQQVQTYIDSGNMQPYWGHIMLIGGNDILDILLKMSLGEAVDMNASAMSVSESILNGMRTLAEAGVKQIIYWPVSGGDVMPRIVLLGASEGFTALATGINGLIQAGIPQIISEFDVEISYLAEVTLEKALGRFLEKNPQAIIDDRCAVYTPPDFQTLESVCDNPENYFFFDSLHPTTAGHEVLAEALLEELGSELPTCQSSEDCPDGLTCGCTSSRRLRKVLFGGMSNDCYCG